MLHKTWIKADGKVRYLADSGLTYTIVDRPLWWHNQGLSQTRSGNGSKLTSAHKVRLLNGREYRVYVTCYGNAGTAWVSIGGLLYVVN